MAETAESALVASPDAVTYPPVLYT